MTNLNKYTEKLFRDMYWKEFDRKDKINANLSLPAGILTVLAGVAAFYMQNFPSTDIDEKVENDLRVFLTAEYSKYGTINTQNNDEKSKYLHHANIAISISLIFLFLSLFPFYIVYHSTSKIQKVEAVNKK